jgi:hypothetical protein
MKRFTRKRVIAAGAALLLLITLGVGYWYSSTVQLVERFSMAVTLDSLETEDSYTHWDHNLKTAEGVEVRLVGRGGLGGDVDVHYGDGSVERVYGYRDYVYATEIRISETSEILYVQAVGLAGGYDQCQRIIEYDLARRKTLFSRRIPSWIPIPQ